MKFLLLFCTPFFIFVRGVNAQVVINEISVQPEDKYDWIEIFAIETIDISGWVIADSTGVFETFPSGITLNSGEYKIVTQYQRLGNEGDSIFLKDFTGAIADQISYGGINQVCIPAANETIARIPDGGNTFDKVSTPTKGSSNDLATLSPCPTPTPEITKIPTQNPTPKPIIKEIPTQRPTLPPKSTPAPNENIEEVTQQGYEPTQTEMGNGVLGSSYENLTPTPLTQPEVSNNKRGKIPLAALFLIGLGIVIVGISSFIFFRNIKNGYNLKDDGS